MQPFQKKEISNFSNSEERQAFFQSTNESKELMHKELDVNKEEQLLLNKRMEMMKSLINELPSSDPQYSMMRAQVKMDQIEIDELKVREAMLIQKLSNI